MSRRKTATEQWREASKAAREVAIESMRHDAEINVAAGFLGNAKAMYLAVRVLREAARTPKPTRRPK